MTVCIAARSEGMLLLASDRMITAGDVEFEPEMPKVTWLSNSICVMFSGDAGLHGEIVQDLMIDFKAKIAAAPDVWLNVRDAANLYLKYWNAAKMRRAESAILGALGHDLTSFFASQATFTPQFVNRYTDQMIDFGMPALSVIVAGVDLRFGAGAPAPSIYTISNIATPAHPDLVCHDTSSFAAIGIGANHAESQFMLARYTVKVPNGVALLLLYSAKKAAEVAPGIGKETDLFAMGPNVGQWLEIPKEMKDKLEAEYRKIRGQEEKVRKKGRSEVTRFLTDMSVS